MRKSKSIIIRLITSIILFVVGSCFYAITKEELIQENIYIKKQIDYLEAEKKSIKYSDDEVRLNNIQYNYRLSYSINKKKIDNWVEEKPSESNINYGSEKIDNDGVLIKENDKEYSQEQKEIREEINRQDLIRQEKVKEIVKLMKESESIKKQMKELQEEILNIANSSFSNKTYEKCYEESMVASVKLRELKNKLEENRAKIECKTNEISACYKEMGNLALKAELIGDPVNITTGDFVAKYDDFIAEDFLNIFSINRGYNHNNFEENFGINWNSSLDARIIRCNFPFVKEMIEKYSENLNRNILLRDKIESYSNEYNNLPYDLSRDYVEILKNIEFLNDELEYLKKIEKSEKIIEEKNKYVTYGRYNNPNSFIGFEENLIFLDEKCQEHYFVYEKDGVWTEVNGELSSFIGLKGLDENNNFSEDINCDGGYELQYKSGDKIRFSKYGIIKEIIDKNNNKTEFISDNGRISEIILKTGEHIIIKRNNAKQIISISGSVSGTAEYTYKDNKLVSVIDNKGIKVSYNYDDKNNLIEIKKSDNSSVKIEYEFNSSINKDVCVSVTNENNKTETFNYDFENSIVYHNFYDQGDEYYKIDEYGHTHEYEDYKKNITKLTRNELGQIIKENKNGIIKEFTYNSQGKLESIKFNQGKQEYFKYNERNQIIEHYDSEGFLNRYEYDEAGNLIASYLGDKCCGKYNYYPNGLLKTVIENQVEYNYKYNEYGSLIEKIVREPSGQSAYYTWQYDNKNKLIKYFSSIGDIKEFEYEENCEIIKEDGIEIKKYYDSRGRLVKEIITDVINKKSIEKRNEYDSSGNIIKVFMDNKLFTEYEYFSNGILKSVCVWNMPESEQLKQCIKTTYEYNDSWLVTKEIKSKVNPETVKEINKKCVLENNYKKTGNNIEVTTKNGYEKTVKRTFDSQGKLVREDYGNDYYIIYNYSKTGKINQIRDNQNNLYNYYYDKNGGYKTVYNNGSAGELVSYYDCYGNLIKTTNNMGYSCTYEYDCFRNLIKIDGINYLCEMKYDKKNRLIYKIVKDLSGKILEEYNVDFDDKNREERILVDGNVKSFIKRDCWNRIIEKNDIDGHFFFKYDCFGNCIEIEDYYGNIQKNSFSPEGSILCIEYPNGQKKNFEYDLSGNVIKISNNKKEFVSYEYGAGYLREKKLGGYSINYYDENNKINKTTKYDTGNHLIERQNNLIKQIDNFNNSISYTLNDIGLITKESNKISGDKQFIYDDLFRISKIINYSGLTEDYSYENNNLTKTVKYSTGEQESITKNIYGNITNVKTNDYSLSYDYDKNGNLISIFSENTNTKINYKYDNFGRCVEKAGANFNFFYSYDERGRISKVKENKKGQWVSFEYDNNSRIKRKNYSNGASSEFSYDSNGFIESMVSRNQLGAIIHGDFIIYDDYNRISLIGDREGNFKKYVYDKDGRLIKTYYPYTKKLCDYYMEEATECGYFIEQNPSLDKIVIEENEQRKIIDLYEKSNVNHFISINENKDYWVEEYKYDKNGNIVSVENPIGTINYEYDSLNRIVSKNYSNTNSYGIKIKWNKDNCLEEYLSQTKKINYVYGARKRPILITEENLLNHKIIEIKYLYDSIGRRVLEENSNSKIEYIYDGITTNLLSKQFLTDNDYVLQTYKRETDNGKIKGENILKYTSSEDYRTLHKSNYKELENDVDKQNDNRAFNVLGVGGNTFLISYNDGSYKENAEIQFPITNYSNEIVGFINEDSDLVNNICYDTWGNISQIEKNSQFTGAKSVNYNFNYMFDLGLRDYIPLLKTFTSEDPIKDGDNWFSYCPCDPINFEDLRGLKKNGLTESEHYYFASELVKNLNYDEEQMGCGVETDVLSSSLLNTLDCADTAAYLTYCALETAGIPMDKLSDEMVLFAQKIAENDINGLKDIFSSANFRKEEGGRRICNGYDRDNIKNNQNDKSKAKEIEYLKKQRKKFLEKIKIPGNITPGCIFVWSNSSDPADGSPDECGHVAIVLEVETDENGIPIGFVCMEGHLGDKKTEITYISIEPRNNCYSFDNYMGKLFMAGEIEDRRVREASRGCEK